LGSVVAVLAYFFKDLVSIATGALAAVKNKDYGDRDLRMVGAIVVGTIPICVIGLLLKPLLEQDNGPFRSINVIACASIVMGLLLVVAEKFAKHVRGLDDITGKDGALVGLAQAIALIPGCSRSGSTLTMAMLLGLKRAEAARFSFLLGIPAVTLAGLLELYHMVKDGLGSDSTGLTSLARWLGIVHGGELFIDCLADSLFAAAQYLDICGLSLDFWRFALAFVNERANSLNRQTKLTVDC
jgi:undecaprenyl-diphosphatase